MQSQIYDWNIKWMDEIKTVLFRIISLQFRSDAVSVIWKEFQGYEMILFLFCTVILVPCIFTIPTNSLTYTYT